MEELYEMIFKRKSMRKFDESLHISIDELKKIKNQINNLTPLMDDIKVEFKIVDKKETTSKRGEYCLLMYSEQKPLYLLNAGYMLEQIDLFMASLEIGVCWYALAKTKEPKINNLDYVIMLAFGKSKDNDFRRDFSKTNRKKLDEIWNGEHFLNIGEIIRYAPSACNTQPWRVYAHEDCLKVFRTTQIKSFIPASKLPYYNSIDMGIFICFMDVVLTKKGCMYDKNIIKGNYSESELVHIATYNLR